MAIFYFYAIYPIWKSGLIFKLCTKPTELYKLLFCIVCITCLLYLFRITLVATEGFMTIQVPYATIEYKTVNTKRDREISIHFAVEYAIDMNNSMYALEVLSV